MMDRTAEAPYAFRQPPSSAVGQKRKSAEVAGMSVPGGKADEIRTITDIQTTPDSHACYSVSASLWFGGLRS